MNTKDSSTTTSVPLVHAYWLQTVLEDRAECAGAPPPAVTDDAGEDE